MLDVLEFYTDRQKREMEDMDFGATLGPRSGGGASGYGNNLSPYSETASAPRFNAGTGLGGAKVSLDGRPGIKRQDSQGINGVDANGAPLSSSAALARAAELVNGSHAAQLQANTMSSTGSPSSRGPLPGSLQPSRPAPPRPLLTANRPAPPAPHGALHKPPLPEHTPSSADLLLRAKAHGPPKETTTKPPGLAEDRVPQRSDSLDRRLPERPNMAPAKSSPATSKPATDPASGGAGSTVGPPPVKPLQPAKKPSAPTVTVTAEKEEGGGVAAAAAALEKPKQVEKRISTMNEAQIMEKLRSVVSADDPKSMYSKIRKVGQG